MDDMGDECLKEHEYLQKGNLQDLVLFLDQPKKMNLSRNPQVN